MKQQYLLSTINVFSPSQNYCTNDSLNNINDTLRNGIIK